MWNELFKLLGTAIGSTSQTLRLAFLVVTGAGCYLLVAVWH
jgi:hypothetical protein